jgi:hypothetical protein
MTGCAVDGAHHLKAANEVPGGAVTQSRAVAHPLHAGNNVFDSLKDTTRFSHSASDIPPVARPRIVSLPRAESQIARALCSDDAGVGGDGWPAFRRGSS